MERSSYTDIRDSMRPGDVIAFGGKGDFSNLIKMFTRGPVSHVGVVLQTQVKGDDGGRYFNQVIESTTLVRSPDEQGKAVMGEPKPKAFKGVQIHRLSRRLANYNGDVWWLPRNTDLDFDGHAFYDFLFKQDGKPYDMGQAIGSALFMLHNIENFSEFFCSELVAAGYEAAGTVGRINASEVTPIELCRWNVFSDYYYQLKGETKEIRGYNSKKVAMEPADA